jgi:hypothetical protein
MRAFRATRGAATHGRQGEACPAQLERSESEDGPALTRIAEFASSSIANRFEL